MSTKITGQRKLESKPEGRMGVASPSTKRRLGAPEEDEVVSAKIAKKYNNLNNNNNEITLSLQDTTGNENSSTDFLTTSILARTLLTTTSSINGSLCPASYALTSDPLESLKSSLEALPAPDIRPFFLSDKTTILSDASDLEFSSLLCHERPIELASSVVTVLSPIDNDNISSKSSSSPFGSGGQNNQLITEDENGKSYFNLGSSDATIVARKSSRSNSFNDGGNGGWNHCNNLNNVNNNDFDDNASSSSCESISSEDLFNSGEEFDASDDDEEELCSYKQQRSTVLHLSLCKLNKFRSQQCVEPSLHRSVLICNTLRHIEQEIKTEDEVDESLKSREKLPSFWRSGSNHCFSNGPNHQPQITDTRPSPANNPNNMNPSNGLLSPNGHDPYLSSPNPYSDAQYLSYDYNSLRPTPYHTTSYEYGEHDLPSSNPPSSQQQQSTILNSTPEIVTPSNNSTLIECDSGYGDDLDLSSYYYAAAAPPNVQSSMTNLVAPPPPTPMDTTCSVNDFGTSSSIPSAIVSSNSSSNLNSVGSSSNGGNVSPPHHGTSVAYLHCGFPPVSSSAVNPPVGVDPVVLMSGEIIDPLRGPSLAKSDMSDNRSTDIINNSNSMTVLSCHPHPNTSPPHNSSGGACDYLGRDYSSSDNGQSSMEHQQQICWSHNGSSLPPKVPAKDNMTTQPSSPVSGTSSSSSSSSSSSVAFVQQESQCGIESRRSELSISNHFSNHNLPMENLISSTYSSSL